VRLGTRGTGAIIPTSWLDGSMDESMRGTPVDITPCPDQIISHFFFVPVDHIAFCAFVLAKEACSLETFFMTSDAVNYLH
jgi:hypothetical protein